MKDGGAFYLTEERWLPLHLMSIMTDPDSMISTQGLLYFSRAEISTGC